MTNVYALFEYWEVDRMKIRPAGETQEQKGRIETLDCFKYFRSSFTSLDLC